MNRIIIILFTLVVFPISAHATMMLQFESSPSSWVGQGESRFATPDNGYIFSVQSLFDNSLYFRVEREGPSHSDPLHDHWSLALAAPFGSMLTVGLYEGATRWPFQNDEDPGLSFSGNHHGNNRNLGVFNILEAVYLPSGEIESLAVDFTQYGEQNSDWWINGKLRYNSDLTLVPLPASVWLFMAGLATLTLVRNARV